MTEKELDIYSYEILKKYLTNVKSSDIAHIEPLPGEEPHMVKDFIYLVRKIRGRIDYLIECLDEDFQNPHSRNKKHPKSDSLFKRLITFWSSHREDKEKN